MHYFFDHKRKIFKKLKRQNILIGILILFGIFTTNANADLVYNPTIAFNGYTIYLSPAKHFISSPGGRGECTNSAENTMAANAAFITAFKHSSSDLLKGLRWRGYKVHIGTGNFNQNITSSNDANTDVHLPIHSNSIPQPRPPCSTTATGNWGTQGIFQEWVAGFPLAVILKNQVGNESPGDGDKTCTTIQCTEFTSLAELNPNRVDAPTRTYLEIEFHTWTIGSQFVFNALEYYFRIAEAIDVYLGYPRAWF